MDSLLSLDDLLKFMTRKGASDLHLKPTRPPLLRLQGKLVPIKSVALKPKDIEDMVLPLLNPFQRNKFDERQSVDIGYGVAGIARFRCNIYQQRGSIAAVFRSIPFEIKDYDDLNLPEVVASFAHYPAGLVLITGPTGAGKSTTLAAIIQDIARSRPCHIVTIEDPIEFLFGDHMATISQREVGTDTPAFHEALRNTMRQDPDVIMVGEMRDIETISTVHHRGRNRPPCALDTPHQQCQPDHRPHHRRLPSGPAGPDPRAARAGPPRGRVYAAPQPARRPGPPAGMRDHDQLPQDLQAHSERGDQGDPRRDRELGLLLPHADA